MADQDKLALAREALEALAEAGVTLDDLQAAEAEQAPVATPVVAGGTKLCRVCGTEPVQPPFEAYCSRACKNVSRGLAPDAGGLRDVIAGRAGVTREQRQKARDASRAHAERIVAALNGVPAPKRAGAHAVTTTSKTMTAVNAVMRAVHGSDDKRLPGEVASRALDVTHGQVTVTFDSAARAKAFAAAAGDAS